MTTTEHGDGTSRHEALSSAVRRRLVDLLRDADGPVDAASLAASVDLHVTTVRWHLAQLDEADLVRSTTVRSGRPGRPTMAWTATDTATGDSSGGYRLLAEILVDGLTDRPPGDDPSDWAQALGERWGPRLLAMLELEHLPAMGAVEQSFAQLGFTPDAVGDELQLHTCPFVELAMGNEEVVCDIHLGMVRGMLRHLDADVRADGLTPFVEPSLCVLHLGAA